MKERMHKITEETLIPLSLLLVFLGGVAWLTNLNALATENVRKLEEITRRQEQYNNLVQTIDNRLNRIEGKLHIKE